MIEITEENKQMISIDTKRLHLRNVLQNDVDVIFDYRNNEICARYQRGQVKDYDLKKLGYKNLGYVPSLDSQAFGKWTTMDTEEEFAHLSK